MFSWCWGKDATLENVPREPNGVAENHSESGTPPSRRGVRWIPGAEPPAASKNKAGKPSKPGTGFRNGNKIVPMLTDDTPTSSNSPLQISSTGACRNYAGDELTELGFTVYTRDNLVSKLPSSSSQPIAVLAVESELPELEGCRIGASVTSARDGGGSFIRKNQQNKVVPVYTNHVCEGYFDISSFKEYAGVIRKLLKRDPLLTFALQKVLRFLKVAEMTSVNHVTPDPSGQTSTLFGMRITPCVWSEGSYLQPALLVEHNVPYNPSEIMPRLMRDYAVLSHVPAILTLIDFQGKVLYQNASSLAYMGDLLSAKYDGRLSDGLLKVLFAYDLDSLEQLLADVLGGEEWQGVVQVPYSLRRFITQPREDDSASTSSMEHNSDREPRQAMMSDELEVQFQIGNSFTTRGLVGMHKKGQLQQLGTKAGQGMSFIQAPNASRPSCTYVTSGGGAGAAACPDDFVLRLDSNANSVSSQPDGAGPSGLDLVHQNRLRSVLDRAEATTGGGSQVVVQGSASYQPHSGNRPFSGNANNMAVRFLNGGDREPGLGRFVEEVDEGQYEDQECFHEVHAIPLLDPVLDKQVIMLVQTDVTPRVELENRLADLTEAQLSMLGHMFPRHIIEYMLARVPKQGSRGMKDLANTHDQVMVLFCDVVGFTSMSKEVEPSQVLHFLNELYEVFDELLDEYGMYKLDIVGDCYIVVAGLIKEDQDGFVCVDEMDEDQVTSNAVRIMQFAKAMLRESKVVLLPHNSEPVQLRIGIHAGKLVSGLIGSKMPKFTLFGDTMNTASRMESTSTVGCVHVSDTFASLLPHEDWEPTGGVEVKGKGLMQTRLWRPICERQELLELEPDSALPRLRTLLQMQSFTSTKSRVLHDFGRSNSFRSRRGSADGNSEDSHHYTRSSNALMAILQNIRGGDGDAEDSANLMMGGGSTMSGGHGGALSRPKSAYNRIPVTISRTRTARGPNGRESGGLMSTEDRLSSSSRSGRGSMGIDERSSRRGTAIDDRKGVRYKSDKKKHVGVTAEGSETFDDASYEPLNLDDEDFNTR